MMITEYQGLSISREISHAESAALDASWKLDNTKDSLERSRLERVIKNSLTRFPFLAVNWRCLEQYKTI